MASYEQQLPFSFPFQTPWHRAGLLRCVTSPQGLRRGCPQPRPCFPPVEMASPRVNCLVVLTAHLKALCLSQKQLGQKDRLLQQHQAKLDEALRKLSEASYQQVGTYAAADGPALLA